MLKARKAPLVFDVEQFSEETKKDIAAWITLSARGDQTYPTTGYNENGSPFMLIHTLEGVMRVEDGDFVIRDVDGDFHPCKPDIFHKTYSVSNGNEFAKMARAKKHLDCMCDKAKAVLDSGFGSKTGENPKVYRDKLQFANTCSEAIDTVMCLKNFLNMIEDHEYESWTGEEILRIMRGYGVTAFDADFEKTLNALSKQVYCTDCENFKMSSPSEFDLGTPDCKFKDVCELRNFVDSMPKSVRPHYEERKTLSVEPLQLAEWLKVAGWEQLGQKRKDVLVFQKEMFGFNLVQIDLPVDKKLSDYKEAFLKALSTAALHSAMSVTDICEEICSDENYQLISPSVL